MKSFFLQSWRALLHQNCDYVKCFSSTVSQNKILLHLLYWACHVFGSQYFSLARSWDYCTDDLRLKLHLSPSATPPDWLGVQKQSEREKQAKREVANTKYSQQFVEKLFFMRVWVKSNEFMVKMLTTHNTKQLKLKYDIPAWQAKL